MGELMVGVATDEWHWEGNVVLSVVQYLRSEGWEIVSVADTASRSRGHDIEARRHGQTLLVEAKGYPSRSYRDPNRAGEVKPTDPTLQARHWYAHAFLKAVQLRGQNPHAWIALALPDKPTYDRLIAQTRFALAELCIGLFLVTEAGDVSFEHQST